MPQRIHSALARRLLLGSALLLSIGTAPDSTPPELQRIRDWNRLGDYAKAEQASRALLAEVERSNGAESLEAADVLDELSVALRRGGKAATEEALQVALRAVDLKRRIAGETNVGYAASLKNLGMLRLQRNEVALAEAPLLESAHIYERVKGPDDPGLAGVLVTIGVLRESEGRYSEAVTLIERSLAIRRKAYGADHPDVAESLNALASLEYDLGDLAPALVHFEEALAIWTRALGPRHPSVSTGHNNIGAIANEMGDLDRAVDEYQRALDLRRRYLGAKHPLTAWTAHNLGSVYQEQGDRRKALLYLEEALRINTSVYGPRGEPLVRTLLCIGEIRLASGDLTGASDALNRAFEIATSSYGPDHIEMTWTLDDLGRLDERLGRNEAARMRYERSLEIRARVLGPQHPDLALSLIPIARVLHRAGEPDSSFPLALRAAEIYRDQLRLTLGALSERQALAFAARRAGGLDAALSFVQGAPPEAARSQDLWDAVIRGRNLVLDEMAARRHAFASAGDSGVARAWEDLATARGAFTTLLVRGGGSDDQTGQIRRAQRRVERAERSVASASRSYRSERKVLDAGWADLAKALPKGEGIVAYSAYRTERSSGYVAFAMVGGSRPVVVPLGKAAAVENAVRDWIALVGRAPSGSGLTDEKAARRAGAALRRVVWDPVIDSIGPIARLNRLSIVPDGALCRVSFAALPEGATGYVVETCPPLRYLSAERDLIPRPTEKPGSGLLALGDAAYGKSSRQGHDPALRSGTAPFGSMTFARLENTGEEVADIASQWPRRNEVTVLSGAQASESAWKRQAPGKLALHLATHAFFLDGSGVAVAAGTRGIGGTVPSGSAKAVPASPLKLSGLALAGANRRNEAQSTDDGILTAEEVASLDLGGVSWAVLSACDTGVGEIRAGEGVIGLRRAFQVAGVRTVVMSLWPVEDRATRDWMERLYRLRFREGRNAADAVLQADRDLLRVRKAQGKSTHPFYWAAFVASGNDE